MGTGRSVARELYLGPWRMNLSRMMAMYNNSVIRGAKQMVLRVRLHFRRQLDGREFDLAKAFIIAGHGNYLIDVPERPLANPDSLFQETKSVLGVK